MVVSVEAPQRADYGQRAAATERLVLSVPEVAATLGVSRSLAWEWVRDGRIPSIRLGRRYLVPKAAIEDMLNGAMRA